MQFVNFNVLRQNDLKEGKIYKSILPIFGRIGQGFYFLKENKDKKQLYYKDFMGRVQKFKASYLCKFVEIK